MPRNSFTNSGKKLTTKDLKDLEDQLGCRLPDDYRRFLSRTNGGRPDKSFFQHAREPCPSTVEWLCTVDEHLAGPNRTSHYMTLAAASYARSSIVPRGMLIIGMVDVEDPLLLCIKGPRKGKVFLKHMGSIDLERMGELDKHRTEAVIKVADSFSDFLDGLDYSDEE